jgi:hypothetical protein
MNAGTRPRPRSAAAPGDQPVSWPSGPLIESAQLTLNVTVKRGFGGDVVLDDPEPISGPDDDETG